MLKPEMLKPNTDAATNHRCLILFNIPEFARGKKAIESGVEA
jgi:hypothetical protein